MGAIGIILLVAFVIVCVLLVLLVLVQDDGQNGMGGLLGGRGTAAFGSHSASVLTKTTTVLVVLFFLITVALALINKKPKAEEDLFVGTETATVQTSEQTESENADEAVAAETSSDGAWWQSTDADKAADSTEKASE